MSLEQGSQHKRGGLSIEYAKSSRAACKACSKSISEGTMRVGKETKSDFHDGYDISWYHFSCCNKHYSAPSFSKIAELKDSETLRWDDQAKVRKQTGETIGDSAAEKQRKQDTDAVWETIDELDGQVPAKLLKVILEANGITVAKMTPSRLLFKVADGMTFGNIGPCPECKNPGTLRYNFVDYFCKGWASEYTRCEFRGTKGVQRYKWIIPDEVKSNKFLKTWTPSKSHPSQVYKPGMEKSDSNSNNNNNNNSNDNNNNNNNNNNQEEEKEEEDIDDGKPEDEVPKGQEFYGMIFILAGTKRELGMTQEALTELIEDHGGEVVTELDGRVTAMIAPESELTKKKKTKKVEAALEAKIPVFSVEFVQNLAERKEEGLKLRENETAKKYLVGDSEIGDKRIAKKYRLENEKKKEEKQKKAEEKQKEEEEKLKKEEEQASKKRKRPMPKTGSAAVTVDPLSEHAHDGEILVTYDDDFGYTPYKVTLNQFDMSIGANKYYKMEIVKIKNKKSYYFLCAWGRVGTDIGSSKVYPKGSEKTAIEAFVAKFEEHTGNDWEKRHLFQKKPGKYFMVALDDGHEEEEDEKEIKDHIEKREHKKRKTDEKSDDMDIEKGAERLPKRLQDFVKLIFDKEMMQKQLLAMQVDVKKMPLGKIKKSQIKNGYMLLSDLQGLLESKDPPKSKIADFTNRFYTLIPHDFGTANVPLIDNVEMVKKKMDLMDALVDLEIASALMTEGGARTSEEEVLEQNYRNLHSKIVPVEKNSDMYKLLEGYAYNTHDSSYFSRFNFVVEDIFEIEREGERKRFDPWAKNENRLLLWHGSRLTNWVGIISQGLRIAPPEAPKTGYRFGKGVYFADVISKSGSYCATSNANPQAVMLLAEVALGKMNELLKDQYMEQPPPGTNSTKALGMTAPDLKQSATILDNVKVPCTKPVSTGIRSACSHNEYIVYDVSQITVRYLLRLKYSHAD